MNESEKQDHCFPIRWKKIYIFAGILCSAIFIGGCAQDQEASKVWHDFMQPGSMRQLFKLENLHNADAKFYGNDIITNIANVCYLYDIHGNLLKQYPEIKANWISDVSEEGLLLYSNADKQVGVAKLDQDENLVSNVIIMNCKKITIDPSLVKVGNTYYFTVTEIDGTVNNSNPDAENGTYTVKLYSSKNMQNPQDIQYQTNIISARNDIEDVDLLNMNNKLYLVYEKEVVDKGNSSICMKSSEDLTDDGIQKWSGEQELLPADSDQEPADFHKNEDNTYTLYYSSDKEEPGTSYMGARIYKAVYNGKFQLRKKDIEVPTINRTGNLLYDVQVTLSGTKYLFTQNYLTDCNLILEEQKNKSNKKQ